VTRRALLHFACAALLLIAQHGALTHSVWHLSKHAPAEANEAHGSTDSPAQHNRSSQSRLCDLHFAMGSLLTGDCGTYHTADAAPVLHWVAASDAAWRIAQPLLTPPSRAPPVLL